VGARDPQTRYTVRRDKVSATSLEVQVGNYFTSHHSS